MARETRIAKKSRTTKRYQGALTWDISSAAFVTTVDKPMRLDIRGFPQKFGCDTTAVKYTSQA
jgi:hypothetical protein